MRIFTNTPLSSVLFKWMAHQPSAHLLCPGLLRVSKENEDATFHVEHAPRTNYITQPRFVYHAEYERMLCFSHTVPLYLFAAEEATRTVKLRSKHYDNRIIADLSFPASLCLKKGDLIFSNLLWGEEPLHCDPPPYLA